MILRGETDTTFVALSLRQTLMGSKFLNRLKASSKPQRFCLSVNFKSDIRDKKASYHCRNGQIGWGFGRLQKNTKYNYCLQSVSKMTALVRVLWCLSGHVYSHILEIRRGLLATLDDSAYSANGIFWKLKNLTGPEGFVACLTWSGLDTWELVVTWSKSRFSMYRTHRAFVARLESRR